MRIVRDQMLSLLAGSHVQVAGEPGASWVTVRDAVSVRSHSEESVVRSSSVDGGYWSPHGFYLVLLADLTGADGTTIGAGTVVFADASSTVSIVGKRGDEKDWISYRRSLDRQAMLSGSMIVAATTFVSLAMRR